MKIIQSGLWVHFSTIAAAIVFLSVGVSSSRAESFTNAVSGIKFKEKYSRKVKFVHAGPFVGDYALLFDNGNFSIQATLSTQGLDFSEFDGNTVVTLNFGGPTLEFGASTTLKQDPEYSQGDTKATIEDTETFNGKTKVIESVSVKIDPLRETITIKVRGNSMASIYAPNNIIEQAGLAAVADREVGQPSHEISEVMFVYVSVQTASNRAGGVAPMTVLGQVKRTERTDSEIGTYPAYNIGIAGLGNR